MSSLRHSFYGALQPALRAKRSCAFGSPLMAMAHAGADERSASSEAAAPTKPRHVPSWRAAMIGAASKD